MLLILDDGDGFGYVRHHRQGNGYGQGVRGMGNGAGNVIQSQSGCRLLCILSRSTCMLPDASQDPTIRHILNDVAVVSVNVPSRPKLLCLSLGRLHVALIEKFASQSRPKAEKRKQIKREKWKKNFFGHLSFDDFRLASIGSGWAGTALAWSGLWSILLMVLYWLLF